MNIKNYKYGIIVDDYGIVKIHNYYERLEDAKYATKEIIAETSLHTINFPIGIKIYIFELLTGITFSEIKFEKG